ncbi:MAG TPA: helix-turn-helix domain-containing protein [Casimicrobiaceae bacterium]
MDQLIAAAARALAAGDPLGALNRVALRDDAAALALRGIAMAQLGDLSRARMLVRRAARAFGPKDIVARARCVVAEAEIALASRELTWPVAALDAACATLENHGDRVNGAHARNLAARRLLLIGRVDDAEQALASLVPAGLPPALRAVHELVVAGIAIRRGRAKPARAALGRADQAARRAGIPPLIAEIESASQALDAPAARLIAHTGERPLPLEGRPLLLDDVEALLDSPAVVVDARRYAVQQRRTNVSLATRPVLFTLLRALAEAWPDDVPRAALIARAFRAKHFDDSHRARLRVEIGRLRARLRAIAGIRATPRGFALVPQCVRDVVVIAPATGDRHAALLAHLADGEAWSTAALALALGASQRSVQRALGSLAATRRVQALGRGRSRRWIVAPIPALTTTLLLAATFRDD